MERDGDVEQCTHHPAALAAHKVNYEAMLRHKSTITPILIAEQTCQQRQQKEEANDFPVAANSGRSGRMHDAKKIVRWVLAGEIMAGLKIVKFEQDRAASRTKCMHRKSMNVGDGLVARICGRTHRT